MNSAEVGRNAVRFDEQLIARYDGRGRRYESYPAASYFNGNFGVDNYHRHAQISNVTRTLPPCCS